MCQPTSEAKFWPYLWALAVTCVYPPCEAMNQLGSSFVSNFYNNISCFQHTFIRVPFISEKKEIRHPLTVIYWRINYIYSILDSTVYLFSFAVIRTYPKLWAWHESGRKHSRQAGITSNSWFENYRSDKLFCNNGATVWMRAMTFTIVRACLILCIWENLNK